MKHNTESFLAFGLSLACTLLYCLAAWYIAMLWTTLVYETETVGRLAFVAIKPLPWSYEFGMLHWQSLAALSLGLNTFWAYRRAQSGKAICLPMSCHLAWLVGATLLHIAGAISSFVAVAYRLA